MQRFSAAVLQLVILTPSLTVNDASLWALLSTSHSGKIVLSSILRRCKTEAQGNDVACLEMNDRGGVLSCQIMMSVQHTG